MTTRLNMGPDAPRSNWGRRLVGDTVESLVR
jgi:hypothetical protein